MELPLRSFPLLTLRQSKEVLIIGLQEVSLCGRMAYNDDVIGLQGWRRWKVLLIVGKGNYGTDWCLKDTAAPDPQTELRQRSDLLDRIREQEQAVTCGHILHVW